jgi:antitoxin component YwqK of YwqJK toxin-antitoxin module
MFRLLAFVSIFLFSFSLQNDGLKRHVVRTHPNGKPYVVVYTLGDSNERVKEELYYENGKLDYVGTYKNGVEHGDWIYYWPNGKMKSFEHYERGLEEGIAYDCDENGQKTIEYHYRKGVLLRKVDLVAHPKN